MVSESDIHYIRYVTDLGEMREVRASEDIYSQARLKLVNKGTPVDRKLFEQLIQHKLLKPIDMSVTVADAVDEAALVAKAHRLVQDELSLQGLIASLWDSGAPMLALSRVRLNPLLRVKLTVARELTPGRFEHLLKVALCSAVIAVHVGLPERDVVAVTAAGLFHDLGELHIDPALFDRGRELSEAERRQVYSHPLLSHLILKAFPEYHPHVSLPVLEHHERLDGSGYPKGIGGDAISMGGRILGVAELAVSLCSHDTCGHLETILKSQSGKYDGEVLGYMIAALRGARSGGPAPAAADVGRAQQNLQVVADCFAIWRECEQRTAGGPGPSALLEERMAALERALISAGVQVGEGQAGLAAMQEDALALDEMATLLQEAVYQLREICRELRRRWPGLGAGEGIAECVSRLDQRLVQ